MSLYALSAASPAIAKSWWPCDRAALRFLEFEPGASPRLCNCAVCRELTPIFQSPTSCRRPCFQRHRHQLSQFYWLIQWLGGLLRPGLSFQFTLANQVPHATTACLWCHRSRWSHACRDRVGILERKSAGRLYHRMWRGFFPYFTRGQTSGARVPDREIFEPTSSSHAKTSTHA